MKRLFIIFAILILSLQPILAATTGQTCNLSSVLLNQDPYPAAPGEPLKVVFQIDGLESSSSGCGDVSVELVQEFPFKIAPGDNPVYNIASGTYLKDFKSFALVPFELVVDKDALEGENTLDLEVSSDFSMGAVTHSFEIEVTDSRTDFEVSVKDYDPVTQILTFQILNIGDNDVEALTVDIPHQDTLSIKGSSRSIVGGLDSNDDTTFSFEAIPKDGDIKLIITYTDEINERRTLEKTATFDPDLFKGRAGTGTGMSVWFYITLIIVLVWAYRWYRNKKRKKHAHH